MFGLPLGTFPGVTLVPLVIMLALTIWALRFRE